MRFYQHPKCTTCRKAKLFLDKAGATYQEIDITQQPPTLKELKTMLDHLGGDVRKLFNTSGQLYRSLGIKDKLADMTDKEALDLLSKQGMLVKRPFLIGSEGGVVGFKEAAWKPFV